MASSEAAASGEGLGATWRRLALFVFLLAIGWAGLEWAMVRSPNSMSVKRDRLDAIAGDVGTLILGSSETYYGLKPKALSGVAYNLANNAQSLYYDYALTRYFLPKLPRLRRAYVLVNYMSLYAELYDHPEAYRMYGYLQEYGIRPQRRIDYLDLRTFSRVLLHSPHSALERLVNGPIAPRDLRIDDRGWYRVPDEDRWGLGVSEAAGRIAVHHGFMRQQHLSGNVVMLERLIELLQEHGVEVVLITTPVYRTYMAQMRRDFWEPAAAAYERVAARYDVRYLNFLDEPGLQAIDFEDADHLNADGAERFARLLELRVGPVGAGKTARVDSASVSARTPARAR